MVVNVLFYNIERGSGPCMARESCTYTLSACIQKRKLLVSMHSSTLHSEQKVVTSIILCNYLRPNYMCCTVSTDHVTHLRASESAGRTVIMTQLYNRTDIDCTLHPYRHAFICVYSQVSLPETLHNVHQIRSTSCS